MAKTLYVPVNNLSSEVKKIIVPVGGVSKYAVKGYCSVNGLSKQFWDAKSKPQWRRLSNAPIQCFNGSATVFKNKIHLISGTSHYSFDGSEWELVSTLPQNVSNCGIVDGGDKLYVIKNVSGGQRSYVWDGISWTALPNLPIYFEGFNNACGYNGVTLVSSKSGVSGFFKSIYQLQGNAWKNVSPTINTNTMFSSCCVFDGEIHYSGNSTSTNTTIHATWNGLSNSALEEVPYGFYEGCMVAHQNKIHFIGSRRTNCTKKHYTWDGTKYEEESELPETTYLCPAVSYKNKLYLFGTAQAQTGDYYNRVYVYE